VCGNTSPRLGQFDDFRGNRRDRCAPEGRLGYKSLYEVYNSDIVQILVKAC